MPTHIITTDDLRDFKIELLKEFQELLQRQAKQSFKKYMRSSDVMDYLKISPGTLQNMRINGTLPFTKMGGIIFYDSEEIQKVMMDNRVHNSL